VYGNGRYSSLGKGIGSGGGERQVAADRAISAWFLGRAVAASSRRNWVVGGRSSLIDAAS
jgi:hypothetical protein